MVPWRGVCTRACVCVSGVVCVCLGGGRGQNVREVLVDAIETAVIASHVVAAYGDGRCGSRAKLEPWSRLTVRLENGRKSDRPSRAELPAAAAAAAPLSALLLPMALRRCERAHAAPPPLRRARTKVVPQQELLELHRWPRKRCWNCQKRSERSPDSPATSGNSARAPRLVKYIVYYMGGGSSVTRNQCYFGFDGGHTPELGRGAGGAAGLRSLSKRVVREESIIFKHSQPEGEDNFAQFCPPKLGPSNILSRDSRDV